MTVRRGDEMLTLTAAPRVPEKGAVNDRAMLGIEWLQDEETVLEYPPPGVQIRKTLRTMKNTIVAVASPKSDIDARHLSGPVGIMNLYYRLFQD